MMSEELKPEAHNKDIPKYNEKPKFKITIGYVASSGWEDFNTELGQ